MWVICFASHQHTHVNACIHTHAHTHTHTHTHISVTGVSLNQIAPQPPVASVSMSSPASSLGRIDDVPTIGELESFTVDGEKVTIMVDVAERWKDLCIAFNFDPVQRTAQKIEQKWNGDAAKCCLEMFQLWLKTQGASWRRLIGVLDHCKELLLVSLIKAYVGAVE